ncbi:hypothetical protein [Pseudomonas vanderleydeniana]|uniref:HNH endonuclease n=1 Tax=Pseudomonas vanderleydeniana TaxID=2745495 RepID=A0A9E6PH61_9PSED|nr:hypothetical protein [Pseudomonas vanderleydeniana]QXI26357.1 hypothetical protein HU752_020710 [Pseudomonas vanderleydeniana]
MIRVQPADEPESFEEKVRQPGLRAIAELIGEQGLEKRKGRPRKVVAQTREEIPADKFPPIWTEALPDLMEAYGRLCAYICIYIERVTGGGSVDHMLPKSQTWNDVYEWQNYRLACTLMNARKNHYQDVLDPFEVEEGWFRLELVSYQVIPGEGLDPGIKARILATIKRLNLNDHDCLKVREEYAKAYFDGDISLDYLRRRAPFLARELEAQGLIVSRQEE